MANQIVKIEEINVLNAHEDMGTESHVAMLYDLLCVQGRQMSKDDMHLLGIGNPGGRVCDLRKRLEKMGGYKIVTEFVYYTNKFGQNKKYARYRAEAI